MRISPVVSLGASAALGLAATFVAWQMTKSEPEEEITVTEIVMPVSNDVAIIVASDVIERGSPVNFENVTVEMWPEDEVPYGHFETVAAIGSTEFSVRQALTAFQPGEPILDSRLSPVGMRASLAGRLEPGYRAYSVRMNDVTGVAGFVLPGDHVDVLFTEDKGGNTRKVKLVADVLLENVEVLAVDRNDDLLSEAPQIFATATLAVKVEDAAKLSVSAGMGDLSLALRGTREEATEKPKPAPVKVAAKPRRRYTPKRIVQASKGPAQIKVMLGQEENEVVVPAGGVQ